MSKKDNSRFFIIEKAFQPFEAETFLNSLLNEFYQLTRSELVFVAFLPDPDSSWDFSLPFLNKLSWEDKHVLKKISNYLDSIKQNNNHSLDFGEKISEILITPYQIFIKPLYHQEQLLGVLFLKNTNIGFSDEQQHIFDLLINNLIFVLSNLRLQNQINLSSRSSQELLAEFSHEFKIPLNIVIGFSDLLFREAEIDEEKKKNYLQNILGGAHHMLNLIQGMLDVSFFESTSSKMKLEQINSKQVIAQVTGSLELLASKKQIKLNLVTIEANIFVELKSFTQLLYNIIQNAIKYAYEKTEINIFSYIENGKFIFEVENKGPFISIEDRDRIFEFFERGESQEAKNREGKGVGLALCKRIVTAHGGEIKFCCSENELTTFWVELPYKMD